jgi:acetyl esterase/lipase
MDRALAEQLRALGDGATPEDVQALYAPQIALQDSSGVWCERDIVYGPHARQRLDVYRPVSQPTAAGCPVLMLMHGGGFIRGDKSQRECFGYWAARAGCVVVVPNYRLAPESRWPSGAEDVVCAWSWARAHAARFGGDAERIALLGESAGAAHVATACLRRAYQPADWHISCVVLISGPYNPRLEARARAQFGISTPDPRNDAYFGCEPALLAEASVVDHVSAAPLPLLISYAERDLIQMQVQAAELFARLVTRHGYAPELHRVPDHNHYSQAWSFGTDDESLSGAVLAFLRAHV